MIPLESPVPEIGTPGSGSGGWKRNHGSRTEDRSESNGYATGPYRRRASPRLYREKCGARTILRQFRQAVRRLAEEGDLLDYAVAYDAERDVVIFRRLEGSLVERIAPAGGPDGIELPDSVAAEARGRHGSGLDLAAAERDWRRWLARKGVRPTNPAALFLSFLAT